MTEKCIRRTAEEIEASWKPGEREAANARIDAIRDEDIDTSDIPEITDYSGFINIARYVNPRDYPTKRAAYDAAIALRNARRQAAE